MLELLTTTAGFLRRESKKQLGHIAKKTGLPGQWEQPEYLSCELP